MNAEHQQPSAHEDWRDCDIGDLCKFQRGFDITEATKKIGTVPVYSSSGLSYFHNEARLKPPAVITGRKGILGKVFLVHEPCWPHDTTLWVKDFKGNDPEFVYWFLRQFRLERFDAATSVPTLNRNNLARIPIRLPPAPEQRAIATALSDVEALLASLDRLIAKKRDLKQATMRELLAGQIRLPGFSDKWEPVSVGSLGRWCSGGTPRIANAEYWSGDIPWISPKDMKVTRLHDAIDHVSVAALSNGTRLLPTGALLIVVRGMILAHSCPVARAERPLAFNQDIKGLVVRPGVDSEFLLWWLVGHEATLLSATTSSTHGTKRLATETLFELELLLPPPTEQAAIAAVLSDMDAEILALEQRRDKTRLLKQGMMQELLTGRTRLV